MSSSPAVRLGAAHSFHTNVPASSSPKQGDRESKKLIRGRLSAKAVSPRGDRVYAARGAFGGRSSSAPMSPVPRGKSFRGALGAKLTQRKNESSGSTPTKAGSSVSDSAARATKQGASRMAGQPSNSFGKGSSLPTLQRSSSCGGGLPESGNRGQSIRAKASQSFVTKKGGGKDSFVHRFPDSKRGEMRLRASFLGGDTFEDEVEASPVRSFRNLEQIAKSTTTKGSKAQFSKTPRAKMGGGNLGDDDENTNIASGANGTKGSQGLEESTAPKAKRLGATGTLLSKLRNKQ